ncbi:hypothetical protein T01_15101 [Trichinella spiralis]|uniref:Uncharacterized protein n=1 Tax=Trichinella spiralis TaxID=6334 RepID=A0A0V1ARZ1_TRISP|nr:hypothetical protein T01_15101 [Trichinella spiralis]
MFLSNKIKFTRCFTEDMIKKASDNEFTPSENDLDKLVKPENMQVRKEIFKAKTLSNRVRRLLDGIEKKTENFKTSELRLMKYSVVIEFKRNFGISSMIYDKMKFYE